MFISCFCLLHNFVNDTNYNMRHLSNRISYLFNINKAKKRLVLDLEALCKL